MLVVEPCGRQADVLDARETGLRDDEYPHISFGAGRGKIFRCFPDKVPIGIDKEDTSRIVFLYLVTRRIPIDFRQFLIRHQTLFLNLHTWTVRLLVPGRFRKAVALYKAALREQLWTPLDSSTALETYFRERKERGGHLGEPGPVHVSGIIRTSRSGDSYAATRAVGRSLVVGRRGATGTTPTTTVSVSVAR